MSAPSPADVLHAHGFHAIVDEERKEHFVGAAKDGLTEVVGAWIDLGMSPDTVYAVSNAPALIAAVEGGHEATIAVLLDRGANIEIRDASEDTPLQTALNWSHPDIARFLVTRGANLDAASKHGETPLEHAIDEDKTEDVELLLELGASPNVVVQGRSAMRSAIEKGGDYLAQLLDAGGDSSLVLNTEKGETALHFAVRLGNTDAVELLLARGAKSDPRDAFGSTPLDYALTMENDALAELLGEATPQQRARAAVWHAIKAGELDEALAAMEGSDVAVDARNHEGSTPLMAFAAAGHVEGLRRLIARGANVNAAIGYQTVVGEAVTNGHDDVLAILLEAKASPVDFEGVPARLQSAIWEEKIDVLRRLLAACSAAQLAKAASNVETAIMKKNVALVRVLADAGVPLEHHDDASDETPLMKAASDYNDVEIARLLLDAGADVNRANKNNVTALHRNVEHYGWDETYAPTTALLLERGARLDIVDWLGRTPWQNAKDEAKEAIVQAFEPRVGLGPEAHSWATLEIVLRIAGAERVLALVDAGVALDPPKGVVAKTLLHVAIEAQDVEFVRALVARGADVEREARYSGTPLMVAASWSSTEILTILLDAGADPKRTALSGSHALHNAVSQPDHVALLLARGAKTDDVVDSPLLAAANARSAETTALLLAHGARVDVQDRWGHTPLLNAIEKEATDVVRLLVEAGASATTIGRRGGETPLTAAAKKGDVAAVELLLAHGGSLADKNAAGEDVLSLVLARKALRQGLASVLAASGIDVSVPKLDPLPAVLTSCNASWRAVYTGDAARVKEAIASGELAADARDPWGVTPLMAAALHADAGLVEALLDAGADPTLRDPAGATAWSYPAFSRDEAVDALLTARTKGRAGGDDANAMMQAMNMQAARAMAAMNVKGAIARGEIKKIATMLAAKEVHPFLGVEGQPLLLAAMDDDDLLGALLELGLSADVTSRGGTTPLRRALESSNLALAERLLAAGANVHHPGLLASVVNDPEAFDWLLARKADVRTLDANGELPIHAACREGSLEALEKLLAVDATLLDARDARGRTPLMRAIESWWSAEVVARTLCERGANVAAFDEEGQSALHLAVTSYLGEAATLILARGASWDAVATDVPDARSARAIADERGMGSDWPNESDGDASSDDDGADDDD